MAQQVSPVHKRSYNVACEAGLWYNGDLNNVVSGGAGNTPDRIRLNWRHIVDIVNPHANFGNTPLDENVVNHPVLAEVYAARATIEDIEEEFKRLETQLEHAKKWLYNAVMDLPTKADMKSVYRDPAIQPRHYTVSLQRLRELQAMPYEDYLQTPEWDRRLYVAYDRAEHRCQICNASKVQIHTHHRTYERRGNELPSDLVVLCQTCHEIFHANGRLAKGDGDAK